MKRIIAYICLIAVIFANMLVFAEDITANEEVTNSASLKQTEAYNVLKKLDIIDTQALLDQQITRGEFAKIIFKLLGLDEATEKLNFKDIGNSHAQYKYIAACCERGLFSGYSEEIFGADLSLSYEEAVVVLVKALGRDIEVKEGTAFPEGYLSVAKSAKITDSEVKPDSKLTYGNLLILVLNALNSHAVINDFSTGALKLDNDETLLNKRFDTYKINGIVTANRFTGIHSVNDKTGVNQLKIDNITYQTDDFTYEKYLGYSVNCYYSDDSILYVSPDNRNRVITINDTDMPVYDSGFLRYENGNRVKKENISVNDDIIYNGTAISVPLSDAQYSVANGYIEFIDNGTGTNVIKINEYSNITVGLISDEKVYDKYSGIVIDFGKLEENIDYRITDIEGNVIPYSFITKWDVLSLFQIDGFKKIVIEDTKIEGQYTGNEDGKIKIDDVLYTPYMSFNNTLKIGDNAVFCIDAYGKITTVQETSDEYEVAFLNDAKYNEDDETVTLKLLMPNQTKLTSILCAEKVTVNQKTYKDASKLMGALRDVNQVDYNADGSNVLRQVIKYSLNDSGKVKYIEIAGMDNGLTRVLENNGRTTERYYDIYDHTFRNGKSYRDTIVDGAILGRNPLIFTVPQNPNGNINLFGTRTLDAISFGSILIPELYRYDNEGLASDVMVMYMKENSGQDYTSIINDDVNIAVVDSYNDVYDEKEEEVVQRLTLYNKTGYHTYNVSENIDLDNLYKGENETAETGKLNPGDVIRISLNGIQTIDCIMAVSSGGKQFEYKDYSMKTSTAEVVKKYEDESIIIVKNSEGKELPLFTGHYKMYVYDSEKKRGDRVQKAEFEDFTFENGKSKILIIRQATDPVAIILYK